MKHSTCSIIVNDEHISFPDLIRALKVSENLEIFHRRARQHLIVQLARQQGIEIDQVDVQKGVDEWRYEKGLEHVEDTHAWLAQRRLTLEDVAFEVANQLFEKELAKRTSEGQIASYFHQNKLDFEEVEISWIWVCDRDVAEEIKAQVVEENKDFGAMARSHSKDEQTRISGGYLGRLRRCDFPERLASLIFTARLGDIVGPVKVKKKYALYHILDRRPVSLTKSLEEEIRTLLFDRWVEREMEKADIAYPILNTTRDGAAF